jgi:hypothetical protein
LPEPPVRVDDTPDASADRWRPTATQLRTPRAQERYYGSLDDAIARAAMRLYCRQHRCITV